MLKFFSSNFGGRNFDALRYFWKKPTNGIFENGQKSTYEAEKSFLESDFDFLDQHAGFGLSYSKVIFCTFFHINIVKIG